MEIYITETRVEGLGDFLYQWTADDIAHAVEQCQDAFPDEKIIKVWLSE